MIRINHDNKTYLFYEGGELFSIEYPATNGNPHGSVAFADVSKPIFVGDLNEEIQNKFKKTLDL